MKYLFLFLIATSFFSCKTTYHQIFETKLINNKSSESKLHTYENDTVLIQYSFWEERGVVAFSIFNKLDKPIYVDWKKSSLILNQEKLNYWADAEFVRSSSIYKSYIFNGNSAGLEYITNGAIVTNTAKAKLERITFIPPKSYYYVSNFKIKNQYYLEFDTSATKTTNDLSNSKKKNYYYVKEYNEVSSPITFRNFLTFSFTENFTTEFYIDNGFYISKIIELDSYDFKVVKRDDKNNPIYTNQGSYSFVNPYKKPKNFYAIIPKGYSVEFRKRWNID